MWHGVTDSLTAPELATRMSHEPLHCPDVLMWPERGLSSWFTSVTQSQFGMSVAVLSPVIKGMTYSWQLTGLMSLLQVKDSVAFFLVEDNIAFSPIYFSQAHCFCLSCTSQRENVKPWPLSEENHSRWKLTWEQGKRWPHGKGILALQIQVSLLHPCIVFLPGGRKDWN